MPINQLSGQSDRNNDYSQWETNDGATYQTFRFSSDEPIQGGRMTINYNAINVNTGASADRMKNVRWKIVNGVASVPNSGAGYTNNDTGMNAADANVIAQGNEVIVTITGVANQIIRHTLHIIKLSSQLNQ